MSGETRARRLTGTFGGAIAVYGLRGPRAAEVLATLGAAAVPAPGALRRAALRSAKGAALDDALLHGIAADEFEIGVHGGRAVLEALQDALIAAGAELEEGPPGSSGSVLRRADRAAAALLAPRAAILLQAQRAGALVRELQRVRVSLAQGEERIARAALERLIETSERCLPFFSPRRIALIGPPNAGKSSFFNAVVGSAQNAVDARAGSTLDPVLARFAIDAWTVDLWDTAGLDPAASGLAARAVGETERLVRSCDLVIWLSRGGRDPVPERWAGRIDREIATCGDLGGSARPDQIAVSALCQPESCRRELGRMLEQRWPIPAELSSAIACAFEADLIEELRSAASAGDARAVDRRLAMLVNALGAIEH